MSTDPTADALEKILNRLEQIENQLEEHNQQFGKLARLADRFQEERDEIRRVIADHRLSDYGNLGPSSRTHLHSADRFWPGRALVGETRSPGGGRRPVNSR